MKRWLRRHRTGLKRILVAATAVTILKLITDSTSFVKLTGDETINFDCVLPNKTNSDNLYRHKEVISEKCPNIKIVPFTLLYFKDIVIDPDKAKQSKGGENLIKVKGQDAGDEDLDPKPGYLNINCNNSSSSNGVVYDSFSNEFQQILHAIIFQSSPQFYNIEENFTIAIKRTDYANFYHTMTEWYNVFIIAYILRKVTKCKVDILFLDGHPYSYLDDTWSVLFGRVIRASFIQKKTMFYNLALSLQGFQSLMNDHSQKVLPLVDHFTRFILQQYGVNKRTAKKCKKLNILFIWRRDYIAHPRNPTGKISRKFQNERELLETIAATFNTHHIHGVQLDRYSMYDQLTLIARTNVLIGMHGAGLSHVLFLPHGSAVIELYPKHTDTSNRHFRAMARWRQITYMSWQNVMEWNEFDDGTYIPPRVLTYLLKKTIKKICD